MTTHAFLDSLTRRGVRLSAASGRLDIDAPAGVLTAEDRVALAEHKAELVAILTAPVPDPCAQVPEPAAPLQFQCPTCEDSSQVVPDVFGVGEPWPKWIDRTGGNPMIHPLPCPSCRPAEWAEARERLRSR
jgi:hypothetical protein